MCAQCGEGQQQATNRATKKEEVQEHGFYSNEIQEDKFWHMRFSITVKKNSGFSHQKL